MIKRGSLFVISAPSGAGKSTLIHNLRHRMEGLGFSVSHTTRSPRGDEVDGVHYHFVDRPKFEQLIKQGAFVEWAEVHGNLYGTSFAAVERMLECGDDVLLDIDVQGGMQVLKKFPDAVLVFVIPPTWYELEKRLRGRDSDPEHVVAERLANARKEIEYAKDYQYLIVNDELGEAVRELMCVVSAARLREMNQKETIERFLATAEDLV